MMKNLRLLCVLILFLAGCRPLTPTPPLEHCLTALAGNSEQAVVVREGGGAGASPVMIQPYEKKAGGWLAVGDAIPGVAGRNGLAPPGEKREGDGRTPSGTFALKRAFGYGALETGLPYMVLTPEMIWIDDPTSPLYNTLATRKEGEGGSYEIMKRDDDLYKYGIVIEYNTDPVVPGAGSAIFYHIWRNQATATAGCIAAAEADIVRLLGWLDAGKKPVTIIGEQGICP